MPMDYIIDDERRIVRMTGSGSLTDAEMKGCIERLRSDPGLAPNMPTISDMRDIEVAFTPQGIRQAIGLMHEAPADRSDAKVAIVVNSSIAFGMGRMFELSANDEVDPRIRIFRSMEEAEVWALQQ